MSHVDDGALHAYLDGELPPSERARLETHVAECPACRTRLAEERALVERASQLLGLAQPAERPAPPMHQLRRPRFMWRLRVPLAWAASVVLAVGLGYYLGGTDYAPPQPETGAPQVPPPTVAREQRAANQVATRHEEPRDRAAAKAVPDSSNVVSGVVATRSQTALRDASPAPVPSAAGGTARPSADLTSERGRLAGAEWPIIRPGPARDLLGADPVVIPGLAVRNIRRSPTGEVVLVEQAIDSATVIQLFEQRMDAEPTPRLLRSAVGTERLARFIGGVRVEIAGPLSPDSLNRLLEQVKPIP
jgi:anti-sigma factor RsiW